MAAVFLFTIGIFAVSPASAQTTGVPVQTVTFVPNFVFDIFTRIMLALTNLALSLMLFVLTFVIEIAGYNGYLSSTAVNVGWVMIRDLTNMIFVVALLMIAFGTILGIEHYEWKHMLFKLVSAAILVNFSRIICGVLIDISQVVMITFVNGIAATVGGNFIRAFNLDNIKSFNPSVTGGQMNSEGVWLAAGASLFISVTILVTMATFLAMLVARVIVLWILIVLSPIAFVFGVLHQTEHYAQEWWSEFGKNVITGPVLIFFLWLTLVTVGNGVIHQEISNGSNSPRESKIDQSTSASFNSGVGKAVSWENLVNFIIAIGMLIAGLRITSHLGGVGAQWSEHAMDYGKSVVRMASGVAAAQKIGQKAGQYAHDRVEKNVELIGGIAKARAGKWWNENVTQKRITAAGERLKTAHERDENGEFKEKSRLKRWKAAAGLYLNPFTPDIVREKIAGSAEKAHELSIEQNAQMASASSHPFGKDKLKSEIALHRMEETGSEIKRVKDEQMHALQHEAYNIMKRTDISDEEKMKMLTTGKFKGIYNETDVGKEQFMVGRTRKAYDSEIEANQLHQIHHEEVAEEKGKIVEGLQGEVKIPGMIIKGNQSGIRAQAVERDIQRRIRQGKLGKEEGEKMWKEFTTNPNFEYELGARTWSDFSDHHKAEHAKAEIGAELNKQVQAGRMSKEQADKIKKDADAKIQHQLRQGEIAELGKKNEQRAKQDSTFKKREEAKAEQGLWKGNNDYQQREKRINEMSHDMQQIQAQTSSDKELSLLTQIRNLLERGSEKSRAIDLAKLTGDRDIGKLLNEKQSLETRAEAARQRKQDTFAGQLQQQADSLIFNKISEGFKNAGLSDNERAFQANAIAGKQKAIYDNARSQGRNTYDDLTEAEKAELKIYTQQKMALTTVNAGSGAYAAQRDMAQSLHAIGWKEGLNEENQLRRWLSSQLGRVVEKGKEADAEKDLIKILGEPEYKASLRHMAINAKRQISEGNRDYILFDEDVDKATGRTQYTVDMKPEGTADPAKARKAKILGNLYGWRSKKDLKVSSMREAMGDRELEADGTGTQLIAIDSENATFNASLLSGGTSQTISRLEGGLLGDINKSKVGEAEFKNQLAEFAKVVADDKAFESLAKQLKDKITQFKISEKDLEKIYEDANK